MNARVPFLREHYRTITHIETVSSMDKRQRLELFEVRRLLRVAFYAELGRNPPFSVSHMPGYVKAARKHWNLKYNNSARSLLAEIEGFSSWEEMMAVTD